MMAGIITSVTRDTRRPSMAAVPNTPPIPSMGRRDIRTIGSIIPSPNIVMQGTVSELLYDSPMVLTESRAMSEASPSGRSAGDVHITLPTTIPAAFRDSHDASNLRVSEGSLSLASSDS